MIAAWKLGPALVTGNSVVIKPAEDASLTTLRIAELALAAGIPEGVVQVVTGDGRAGEALSLHRDVDCLTFTGSGEVGRKLLIASAQSNMKRVHLELGGKSANIVFADCDLERAAATAPYGVFDNAGQDCCARSRILVQASVYDRFMELLEPAVKGVRVEDPSLPTAEMGPLISQGQWETVSSYVPDDAPVAFRGSCPEGPGYWFPPTVLAPVSADDRTYREEIFGPVVVVASFDDEADAIRMANDSEFGLSGSIWTSDVGRALRVSRAVDTGNLSVNSHSSVRYSTPFGGFKQSGLGRELGPDALDAFTEVKNVFIATD
jgi:acyl-CoA reductase-like NAD-dependent aldehyde dehydrogenase